MDDGTRGPVGSTAKNRSGGGLARLIEMIDKPTDTGLAASDPAPDAPLTCEQAIDRFGDYLANDLPPELRKAFIEHLRMCESCHDKLLVLELYLHISGTAEPAAAERAEDKAPPHQP